MLVGEIGTTVETTSVRVDGLRVRCLVAGKGAAPPVVLLHGGGFDCAGLSYRYAIEPLSRLRPVIAFDWPGYGGRIRRTSGAISPTMGASSRA